MWRESVKLPGVYQVHCIEDNDANKKITSYFYGTTYAEKYVTPPKLDGYMFVGYSESQPITMMDV